MRFTFDLRTRWRPVMLRPLIVLVTLCCPMSPPTQAAGQGVPPHRRALLVGISAYGRPGNLKAWADLKGTSIQDVDQMRHCLIERFQFKPDDITILKDKQATGKAIRDALDDLARQANPGDTVVFQFSGHGQQIPNHTGDSFDGLDESLVPYDYLTNSAQDGDQTNLRDKEIHAWIGKLHDHMKGADGKLDGNITLIIDSCHSGGMARSGDSLLRGRDWDDTLDGKRPTPRRAAGRRGADEQDSGWLRNGNAQAEGYVLLAACRSGETAGATPQSISPRMGAFTYCLLRALNGERIDTHATYRTLLEEVNVEVAAMARATDHDQHPQMEGEVDRPLFANFGAECPATPLRPYVTVEPVNEAADAAQGADLVKLPVGTLAGAERGSIYRVYGTNEDIHAPNGGLADVRVIRTNLVSCLAVITEEYRGKVKPEKLMGLRAVERAHHFAGKLKVYLNDRALLAPVLAGMDVVDTQGKTDQDCDLRLLRQEQGVVLTPGSSSYRALQRVAESQPRVLKLPLPQDPAAQQAVRDAVLGEWRWRLFAALRNQANPPEVQLDLRLIPVNVRCNNQGWVTQVVSDRTDLKPTPGNHLVLPNHSYFMLEARNRSQRQGDDSMKPVYLSVFVLSGDGSIEPLFPNPKQPDYDKNDIPPDGEWHRIPMPFVFRVDGKGDEMIKAVVTTEPTDFSSLVYTPPNVRGDEPVRGGPLAELLRSTRTGRTRGEIELNSQWNTTEITYEIIANKQ